MREQCAARVEDQPGVCPLLQSGVVREFFSEATITELACETDALIARKPAPAEKVSAHHYFEAPSSMPVAERALREGGLLALAGQLTAPSHKVGMRVCSAHHLTMTSGEPRARALARWTASAPRSW